MPDEQRTGIRDPNAPDEDAKWFTFDHSYWSHDGFNENADGYLEPINNHYADQVKTSTYLYKFLINFQTSSIHAHIE